MTLIKTDITLMDTDQAFRLVIGSPDIRRWEKTSGLSWGGDNISETNVGEAAYYAARRTGQYDGTLEQWQAIADVDLVTEPGGDGDPTPSAAGESSSSG